MRDGPLSGIENGGMDSSSVPVVERKLDSLQYESNFLFCVVIVCEKLSS